jgi:hypothetical protein
MNLRPVCNRSFYEILREGKQEVFQTFPVWPDFKRQKSHLKSWNGPEFAFLCASILKLGFMRGVYILAVMVASLFISLGDLASQTNTATVQKRFLFIVETSDASKSGVANIQKLLTTLIESGMGGLMEKGDTFGMWTFNEKLYAGQVPMQRWDPASAPEVAKRVAEFIKNQKFDKDPKMEPVLLPMLSLIRSSPILTVVLVTSGKKPIQGTPFDREINEFYKANYREYQKQKTPFVTMLLSQRGEVRRHSVSPAVGDVKIPKPLPMPEPVVAQIPPVQPLPITAPVSPTPALPPKALVITKSGAKTFEGTDAIALAQAEEPLKSITTAPIPTQITTNAAAEPAPAPTPAATPAPIPPAPTPETNTVVQTNQPVTDPTPPTAAPAPASVAQEEKKPSDTNTTVTTTVAVPEPPPTVPPAVTHPPVPAPTPVTAAPAQAVPTVSTATATNAALTAAVTEQKAEALPPAVPVATKTEPAVQPTAPIAPTVQTPPPVAAETPPLPSVAAPAAPAPVPTPQFATSNSKTYLIIGFALVIVAVITAFLIGRQTGRKPDRSLITDWANRQK